MIFTSGKLSQCLKILSLGGMAILMTYNTAHAAGKAKPLTKTLEVTASVEASCNLDTSGALNFGAYTGAELRSSGTITVNCNAGVEYSVDADQGKYFQDNIRRMKHSDNAANAYIPYSLKKDMGENFGGTGVADGEAGDVYFVSKDENKDGGPRTFNVNGVIAGGLKPPVGSYTDTVTIILEF